MAETFSRTLRSLRADAPRPGRLAVVGAVLVLGWSAWLVAGEVPVYEVADQARLEVTSAAHPVTAPVGGRVVHTALVLGREVRAGDVLVVLDGEAERAALEEKRARRADLVARRAALRREIEAEQQALGVQQRARVAALDEARAQLAEAEVRARSAQRQAEV